MVVQLGIVGRQLRKPVESDLHQPRPSFEERWAVYVSHTAWRIGRYWRGEVIEKGSAESRDGGGRRRRRRRRTDETASDGGGDHS